MYCYVKRGSAGGCVLLGALLDIAFLRIVVAKEKLNADIDRIGFLPPCVFCLSSFLPLFIMSYTIIPPPASLETFQRVAFLKTPRGPLNIYWWAEMRSVIVHEKRSFRWLLFDDVPIGSMLATVLQTDLPLTLSKNTLLYEGYQQQEGVDIPDDVYQTFFECDWSDYSCDGLFVSGSVTLG